MSALSRFGPQAARSVLFQHQRHMASASVASDPVQKLFLDKVKEFKTSNKGLDESHQRALKEELLRLKRVYRVEDENKLAQYDYKFSNETNVSLHDLDESKGLREKIASGEYEKQLTSAPKPVSALLASTPEQVTRDLHLPPLNKPDPVLIMTEPADALAPAQVGESRPDYDFVGDKMTPNRLERDMLVKFGPDMPTIHDDKAPERDTVNFPRLNQPLDTPPTRFHIIPESWFQFFYPKTGVTGPFAFAGSFGAFLLSKEWIPYEHELLTGMTSTFIFAYAVTKFGPSLSKWANGKLKLQCDGWEHWRKGNIATLEKLQEHYKNEMKKSELVDDIYAIRRQDVEAQLESEYRTRLKTIYEDTRRRLNYLVAVADSSRQVAHNNMVNWVISNAVASFGQKQENEVLDNCIGSLKQLASKNANVI